MVSKPYVVLAFSLDTPTSKHAVCDKVERLLDEAHYIYKVCSVLPLFIVNILIVGGQPHWSRTWSRKQAYSLHLSSKCSSIKLGSEEKKDDGVVHPEFFEDEMLLLSTIALVLMIVSPYIYFPHHG